MEALSGPDRMAGLISKCIVSFLTTLSIASSTIFEVKKLPLLCKQALMLLQRGLYALGQPISLENLKLALQSEDSLL
jgi:hypothetical protein